MAKSTSSLLINQQIVSTLISALLDSSPANAIYACSLEPLQICDLSQTHSQNVQETQQKFPRRVLLILRCSGLTADDCQIEARY